MILYRATGSNPNSEDRSFEGAARFRNAQWSSQQYVNWITGITNKSGYKGPSQELLERNLLFHRVGSRDFSCKGGTLELNTKYFRRIYGASTEHRDRLFFLLHVCWRGTGGGGVTQKSGSRREIKRTITTINKPDAGLPQYTKARGL